MTEFCEYYILLLNNQNTDECWGRIEKLAEKLNCDVSFIGQIEAPNIYKAISLETLFRIADALDVPPYKFLKFED